MNLCRTGLVAALSSLMALPASAQNSPPAPPAANDIPLALAKEAAEAALDACTANGYKVTATVADKDYAIRVTLRADGAGAHTPEIGRRKTYTVLKTGMSSLDYAKKIGPQPRPPGGGPMMDPSGDKDIFLAGGGVQIKKGNDVVGALAISGAPGGDKDDACALVGLAKIADRLK